MEINDFVYSLINGIGIITDISSNMATVFYENGQNINENLFDLSKINNNVIDMIKSNEFYEHLPEIYIERAKDIISQKRVDKIVLMDSNLTTTVSGSNTQKYRVNVTFGRNKFRSSCSCPVEDSSCKHVAAVLIELSNKINYLLHRNYKSDLSSYIKTIPSKIINERSLMLLDEFGVFLNTYDISNLDNDLEIIEKIADNNVLSKIIYMLYYNKNTNSYFIKNNFNLHPRILSIVSKIECYPEIINQIDSSEYVTRSINHELSIYSLLSNQKYEKLFILALNESRIFQAFYSYLIDKISINNNIIDHVYNSRYLNIRFKDDLEEKIYDLSNLKQKEYIIDEYHPKSINVDSIDELSYAKQLYLFKSLDDKRMVIKRIANNFYTYFDLDKIELFEIIIRDFSYGNKQDKKKILDYLSNIKEASFIKYLLESYESCPKLIPFNPYEFFSFYKYKAKIYKNTDKASVDVIIEISIGDLSVLTISYDGNYYNGSGLYSYEFINNYAKDIFNYVLENNDSIEDEYKEALADIKDLIIEKKKKDYLYAIRRLSNKFDDKDLLVDKISIQYEFNKIISYKTTEIEYEMSLKVGNNKYYIVKNIKEFLSNIENNKTYKYGANLEFNHNIKNFDEKEIDVLNYLLALPYESYYSNNKYLIIPKKCFEAILNLLKGRNIILNDKEYSVRLDEISPNIFVDENMILKTNIDKDKIINLSNLYYIDEFDNINKINASSDLINLIEFASENENMDISIIKKEFIDNVYSRFIDDIRLPSVLEEEYRANMIRIESYFDYQNGAISCDTKVYKGDTLLTSDSFMNVNDKKKFIKYSNYLNKLGFIDLKILTDPSLILQFFNMDFSEFRKLADIYLSDNIKNKSVAKFVSPSIRIQYKNNMMEAFLEDSIYESSELESIMKAIRMKKNYVLLDDDRIIEIDNEESNEFYEAVTDLRLDIKNLYSKQRIETYDALKAYAYLENCSVDDYISKMILDIKGFKSFDIELPKLKDGVVLRKYQRDAFKWISVLTKYHMGGILADDMGLGKTLEIIAAMKANDMEMPSLIVCPKTLLFNWHTEFEKFDGESDVRMIYGNLAQRRNRIYGINPNKRVIYITSYDSLKNDIDLYSDKQFEYLILDEAQNIKNVNALKSITVKSIEANHRIALTGTPIENNIIDLWSIFDFVMPGYLQNLNTFKGRYLNNGEFSSIVKKKVSPFILRRTKEEVLKDLPPKFERIVSCDMNEYQRKIYDAHINDAKLKLEGGMSIEILSYLTRLRQICVDPKLFLDEYENSSGKIEYLKELIPEYINNGHKILIFSSFVKALNLVSSLLDELNIRYFMLTGDTGLEQRKYETDEFNRNNDIKIYLISLKAGGTGLNLVGADTVIHLDPWWNLSAENQATDRAHRIGQARNVEVIKLIASESIEERVIELQEIKKRVIDDLISNNDSSITGITIDDLKFILG